MMRRTRLCPALLLACLALLVQPASALASDAQTYAPSFQLRSDLECWPSMPGNGENSGECRSRAAFEANPPPVFWEEHVITHNGVTAKLITYWVYYGNQNNCSTFGGGHVDDWERITVHLQDGNLRHVSYNQHNGRYTLDAADVPLKDGRHPIVYVGKYSHGGYHDQRARCTLDGLCYTDGNYCFYWKDPRGPGVEWTPSLLPLTELSPAAVFPGSTNPRQRTRPEYDTVCRTDGGQDVIFGIGLENTCERNPTDLKDPALTLKQMAVNDLVSTPLSVTPAYGGNGGSAFDDRQHIPLDGIAYLKRITLRTGSRVDQLQLQLVSGSGNTLTFSHGGNGGSPRSLELAPGEFIKQAEVHIGRKSGSDRVFYLKLTTSSGRTLAGGSQTSKRFVMTAPAGQQLVASYGRAGSELDRIGFVMMPE